MKVATRNPCNLMESEAELSVFKFRTGRSISFSFDRSIDRKTKTRFLSVPWPFVAG